MQDISYERLTLGKSESGFSIILSTRPFRAGPSGPMEQILPPRHRPQSGHVLEMFVTSLQVESAPRPLLIAPAYRVFTNFAVVMAV